MKWRRVGAEGPYPAWLRALRGRSGVYAIRSIGVFGEVLYVGESHTGRLYQTGGRSGARLDRAARPA